MSVTLSWVLNGDLVHRKAPRSVAFSTDNLTLHIVSQPTAMQKKVLRAWVIASSNKASEKDFLARWWHCIFHALVVCWNFLRRMFGLFWFRMCGIVWVSRPLYCPLILWNPRCPVLPEPDADFDPVSLAWRVDVQDRYQGPQKLRVALRGIWQSTRIHIAPNMARRIYYNVVDGPTIRGLRMRRTVRRASWLGRSSSVGAGRFSLDSLALGFCCARSTYRNTPTTKSMECFLGGIFSSNNVSLTMPHLVGAQSQNQETEPSAAVAPWEVEVIFKHPIKQQINFESNRRP